MKRAVIVHCWSGTPDYCWYPWVKQELEQRGFKVTVPAMPDTDAPKLSWWLPKLVETVSDPDEELYLIGHSAGCITIMRYLEQLPADTKIAGIVLVAGFTNDLGMPELSNFYKTPVDFEAIKARVADGIYLIHSDNDQYVPVQEGKILEEKLSGRLQILHNMGHFSGDVDDEASCLRLPEVVQAIEEAEAH